jgi:hypothetical protein
MNILNFLNRLIERPPLISDGDGIILEEDTQRHIARRINNGGGFYFPVPPPPIHQIPTEEPEPPMVADIVNKIKKEQPRDVPTTTSSLWCGTTVTDDYSFLTKPKDPLVLDSNALKHFLVKRYSWILDVTEVRVKPKSRITNHIPGSIYFGPLEIHITVSPIHHSELMNPDIEKKVREKLYLELLPLITCMYENNSNEKPIIIFSPEHSETILEYVK